MQSSISRRAVVRAVSFATALVVVLSFFVFTNIRRADAAELKLEYQYLKSIDDLTTHMENIDSTLLKLLYSGTQSTMTPLSSKLWRESGFAKECLATLPIGTLRLENTYKFLSQAGDYAVSLSDKLLDNETISEEERQNLEKLKKYAHKFLQEVLVVQDGVSTGSLSFQRVKEDVKETDDKKNAPSFSDGFQEFEEGFTAYPTLIYDGPFSDNILEKEPEMVQAAKQVTKEEAKKTASQACNVAVTKLNDDSDEAGKMPSYCFDNNNINIAITKQGGYVSYMVNNREIGDATVSIEECKKTAERYLTKLGYQSISQTYYEIKNGLMTINYAATQDDVILYPDLLKVSVAMDNGEVVRFDARGYLTNHKQREDLIATVPENKIPDTISPLLSIEKIRLCVIPSKGTSESFCYEVKCVSEDKNQVLVYIDAKTGKETEILILYTDENGALTL